RVVRRPRGDGARQAPRPAPRPAPRQPVRRSAGPAPAPRRRAPEAAPVDEDEDVLRPPPAKGGRRLLAGGGARIPIGGVLVGALLIWAARQVNPPGEPGEAIAELVVPSGSSVDSIGTLLEDEGVITSARMFRYYVSWKGGGPWEAGTYIDFRKASSF